MCQNSTLTYDRGEKEDSENLYMCDFLQPSTQDIYCTYSWSFQFMWFKSLPNSVL